MCRPDEVALILRLANNVRPDKTLVDPGAPEPVAPGTGSIIARDGEGDLAGG